mgnify:CR=1 FL=1
MNIYSIYKVVNKINGKIYIGFDSNWPSRKKTHYYNHRTKNCPNWTFYKSLKKYGWENFNWEVIYQSKDGDHCLNIMEPYFIKEYNSFKTGYNSTLGGEGSLGKKQTDKNKKNQSLLITERNKKCRWYNDGIENRFSEEIPGNNWVLGRLYQKPTTKGCKWYNNGIEQKLTKQVPEGWKKGMLPKSLETCKKISLAKKGQLGKKIKTPDGIFNSISEASKFYNVSTTWIKRRIELFPDNFNLISIFLSFSYLSITILIYEEKLNYPNILSIIFCFFLTKNNPLKINGL